MLLFNNPLRKHRLLLLSFGFCLFLLGCKLKTYPWDHEQLSREERLVIRFSHVVGEETPKGMAARKFAKLMGERTNGYVEVQVFPNSYLYKDGEEIDALLRGDLQMIAPATSKISELVPEWSVLDLPFAFESEQEVHAYLQSPIGEELFNKLTNVGMIALSVWDNGFKQLSNNRSPIIHPSDIQGLRFRIMPSEIIEQQFRVLGAETEVLAFNDLFMRLENNEVDAQENSISNIVSRELHTLQDYLTISNHAYLGYLVLVNRDFWNELPEEIKAVFQETLAEVTEWEKELALELNEKKIAELEQCECIAIYELTEKERKEWEQAFEPLYTYFIERFGSKYIEYLPKYNKKKAPL